MINFKVQLPSYSENAFLLTFDLSMWCQSKVRWRFRKILWPSQNIWTLPESLFVSPENINYISMLTDILRRPQNFVKYSSYLWLALHRTKVSWRFRKILWLSQNNYLNFEIYHTLLLLIPESLFVSPENINNISMLTIFNHNIKFLLS